jgi:hypothetical protein
MIGPHKGIPYWCPIHGHQLAKGCVIQCPVCEHIDFLEQYSPETVEEFKDAWQGSEFNDPPGEEDWLE